MNTILVTFATKYGSTGEVADAVGDRLREHGFQVEVTPVREVRSTDQYHAVVLGTPFYFGSMLKDAKRFLELHKQELENRPVAIFALGPLSADEDLASARDQLDKALDKMPWLDCAAAEMFIGKYDPTKLRLFDKLIASLPASPLSGMGAQDNRDWNAVKAWTDTLPGAFRLEAAA